MADRYDPPEDKIEKVLRQTGGDPRKLAIAYLRAQRRAQEAELAFGVMGDVNDLTISTFAGALHGAQAAVARAKRRTAAHREMTEQP